VSILPGKSGKNADKGSLTFLQQYCLNACWRSLCKIKLVDPFKGSSAKKINKMPTDTDTD
jgi:hypothetical protein